MVSSASTNHGTDVHSINLEAADSGGGVASEQKKCQGLLDTLVQREVALKFATMCTLDGRSYAHASSGSHPQPERVGAVTSSVLGLSEAFAREAALGGSSYTAISTAQGSIVTVRVPSRVPRYALSICADPTQNMGATLRSALDTADAVARVIDSAA